MDTDAPSDDEDLRSLTCKPTDDSPANCWSNVSFLYFTFNQIPLPIIANSLQVESVEMTTVAPQYRQIVLKVLGKGESLKKLMTLDE